MTNRMTIREGSAVIAIPLALVVACGGGSAPTTPTTTTAPPSSTIQVSGAAVVGIGATTQLLATITTAGVTTAASVATWQSHSPQVATVSSSGLVTGVSAGQALIAATENGATGQITVTVQSASTGITTLTACGRITAPGNYTLANDLAGSASCVAITNVAGVHLDCGSHTLPGLSLTDVSAATVTNCSVSAETDLASVTSVTITQSTLNNGLNIGRGQSVIVSDSTITSASVPVFSGSGNDVELLRDVISSGGSGVAYGVSFFNGSNNRVEQTTISSTYDGSSARVGADDGIIMTAEVGDTIHANTISGFFDLGVEGVGAVASTTIAGNTFSNIGNGAVGSYYCTDWTNNVVQGNSVSQTPTLVFVGYQSDTVHCGSTLAPAVFTNNQFIGNFFRNPIHSMVNKSGRGPSMSVVFGPGATVSGNVVKSNDFATFDGPDLIPLDGFIDGGGNICGPLDPNFSNFACSGSTTRRGFAVFSSPAPHGAVAPR